MTTWAYGRVSTVGQTADNQRLEIETAGYRVDRWLADEGVSGKVPALERPKLAKLFDADTGALPGDTLIVSKIDRLGRDAADVLRTVDHFAARGVKVKVLQLGDTDLTSPAGKLILTVLSAIAAMERDLLIERTQAGLQRVKAEGAKLGRPARLTEAQRAEIRQRHARGESKKSLAAIFNVSRPTVDAAVANA